MKLVNVSGSVWRKGWVRQLSACKVVQVLKAVATQIVKRPRRDTGALEEIIFPILEYLGISDDSGAI